MIKGGAAKKAKTEHRKLTQGSRATARGRTMQSAVEAKVEKTAGSGKKRRRAHKTGEHSRVNGSVASERAA